MNNNGRGESNPLTPSQFHALIRQSAISRGMVAPETDEEFALMEKNVDPSGLPKHDFQDVLQLIETGEVPSSKVISFSAASADAEIVEEFAQAARNGATIPEEIQKKMDADRAAAEQDAKRNR